MIKLVYKSIKRLSFINYVYKHVCMYIYVDAYRHENNDTTSHSKDKKFVLK